MSFIITLFFQYFCSRDDLIVIVKVIADKLVTNAILLKSKICRIPIRRGCIIQIYSICLDELIKQNRNVNVFIPQFYDSLHFLILIFLVWALPTFFILMMHIKGVYHFNHIHFLLLNDAFIYLIYQVSLCIVRAWHNNSRMVCRFAVLVNWIILEKGFVNIFAYHFELILKSVDEFTHFGKVSFDLWH